MKKKISFVISFLMAVSILVPSYNTKGSVHAEESPTNSTVHKDISEVVTKKTATQNEDGSYHVKVEAYNTAYSIYNVPTDTILVVERSSKMSDVLYSRDKTNLKTYTTFTPFSSMPTHNDLYEGDDNPDNSTGISLAVTHRYNKYIKDPNNPEIYVYLCQTYKMRWEFIIGYNDYSYQVVDSKGNVYETGTYSQWMGTSIVGEIIPAFNISSLNFHWVSGPNGSTAAENGVVDSFTLNKASDFFERDDDNALNKDLYNEYLQNGLWIEDDYGELRPVSMEPVDDPNRNNRLIYYKYTMTDSKGKTYTAYYGNPVFGTDYSVFQGFKSYDDNGEVIHEDSVEHKTLYAGRTQNVTKLLAMQEATEDFILKVHKNAYDNGLVNGEQKIGIVSYASKSELIYTNRLSRTEYPLTDVYNEDDVYKMIKTVYAMEADGRRRIDVGMQYAEEMLDNRKQSGSNNNLNTSENPGSAPDHNVNVIAFTTGMPSTDINGSFETDVANTAIQKARSIESKYPKAKIYSIGMFDLADENQLNGDWFYRMTHANVPCDGSEGSYWGGTALSGITNWDMDPRDAAATNRFLNYLSSNFKTATRIGIDGPKYIRPGFWSTGGTGYEIEKNFDRTNTGYYYAGDHSDVIMSAFDNIAESIQVPISELREDTALVDQVSDYFNIKGNVSSYTMRYDGSGDPEDASSWSAGTPMTATTSNGGKTISLTGFDYATNYCVPGHPGEKTVMEFDVEPIDGFLGGHDVPTNRGSSALYDRNNTVVENLPYPKVDVPLTSDVSTHDQFIYYGNEADLANLFDVSPYAQGLTNDFVDVTYYIIDPAADISTDPDADKVMTYTVFAGKDEGESSLTGESKENQYPALESNKEYTIRCVVSTVDNDVNRRETKEKTDHATVYVYKPTLTVMDTTKDYADAVRGVDLNENRVSVTWSAEDTEHAPPSENVPILEYDFYDLNNTPKTKITDPDSHSISETTDFNVDLIIKGHSFSYTTILPYYVMENGTNVLIKDYDANPSSYGNRKQIYFEDEDGNLQPLTEEDENGNQVPVYETVSLETVVQADKADIKDSVEHFTTYVNQTDDSKTENGTEGNFTVYTGVPFDFFLQKVYDGDYAVPEGVKITITGTDGSENELTFQDDDFINLKSGKIKFDTQLVSGVTYTLTESYLNAQTLPEKYDTTAQIQVDDKEKADLEDTDETDGVPIFEFTVPNSDEPSEVFVIVTNTDTKTMPPATSLSSAESENQNLITAMVGLICLTALGFYLINKKRTKKSD